LRWAASSQPRRALKKTSAIKAHADRHRHHDAEDERNPAVDAHLGLDVRPRLHQERHGEERQAAQNDRCEDAG